MSGLLIPRRVVQLRAQACRARATTPRTWCRTPCCVRSSAGSSTGWERAWLFTIRYHLFVSRKRRIDAREVLAPDDSDGSTIFEQVGDTDPERTFYDSFIDEEIVAAIRALPEEYKSAVMLSDVHGLRYAEIATALGVPEGTVKSRLFRGRRR